MKGGQTVAKITLVGAGSHVFSHRLITDVLTWPSLQDAILCLMDIDEEKLALTAKFARKLVQQLGVGAQVVATSDIREAVAGADYVIIAIRVGESRNHITIPYRYGINQAIGDTMGPGGVFYFLRNMPAILSIVQAVEELAPQALILNYTNPMGMISWAVKELCNVRYVGLCHSVQGTARTLAEYIGAPFEQVSYWAAGINHMAWFLRFEWRGEDAYPLLWKAMEDPDIYARDIVKWEIMRYFGAFVSESSIHNSEYMPYFRRTPALIERYTSDRMWGVSPGNLDPDARWARVLERRKAQDEETRRLVASDAPLPAERSHEYCSHILNAKQTNTPFVFNGNVPNEGLISNLPANSIVEVPILVDGTGLHPCQVGNLLPALAALNRSNLAVQELAVKGFIEQDRKSIYQAIQLDPLTAAILPLPDIRKMVDEIFEADKEYLPF